MIQLGSIRGVSKGIAENMLTQIDSNGFSLALVEGIIDYKHDDSIAIPKAEKYITTGRGQRRLQKTMAGWKLLVKWKDQSESWVKLSELKESHLWRQQNLQNQEA